LVQTIFTGVGLEKNKQLNIRRSEDNSGAHSLANLELPHMTPRSKHFVVKYQWFRARLKP